MRLKIKPLAREALAYPDYRIFVASGLLNFTSFAMHNVVRAWLISTLTESPLLIASVVVASLAPVPLLSIFGGLIADRFNRKSVVIVADVFFVGTSVVLILITAFEVVEAWHVLAIALLNGVSFAFAAASRQTMYALTIPVRLIRPGAEFYAFMFNWGTLLGPALSFVTLPTWGIVPSMIIASAIKVLSIVVLAFISLRKEPRRSATTVHNLMEDLREGLRFVYRSFDLRLLLTLLIVVGITVGSYRAILPVFARDVLGTTDAQFALLNLFAGIGAVIGSLGVVVFDSKLKYRRDSYLFGVVGCLAALLLALTANFWLSGLLVGIIGGLFGAFLAINVSNVAELTPGGIRGRVASVRFILMGLTSAGGVLIGVLAESLTTAWSIALMAILGLAVLALVFLLEHIHGAVKQLRQLNNPFIK